MNKNKTEQTEDEMRPEYDLTKLTGRVRGKYVERYRSGTNLILLEADVQAAFRGRGSRQRSTANANESRPPSNAKIKLNIGDKITSVEFNNDCI